MYCRLCHCLEGPHTNSHCCHSHTHFLVLTPTFNSHFHFQSSQSLLPLLILTPTSIVTPTSILTPTSHLHSQFNPHSHFNPHPHFQSSLPLPVLTLTSMFFLPHQNLSFSQESKCPHEEAQVWRLTSKPWPGNNQQEVNALCLWRSIRMHIAPVCYFSNPTNGYLFTQHTTIEIVWL